MRRLNDFVERQPGWRMYSVFLVLALTVGLLTGHSTEAAIDNTLVALIVMAIGDTIRWIPKRRRRRELR